MLYNSKLQIIACLLLLICSGGHAQSGVKIQPLPLANDTVSYTALGKLKRGELTISDTIDLDNRRCVLPEGIMLNFKGGVIRNGTLVGNKTRLKSSGVCFDRVRILGTWNVPVIKSTMFQDLSYENALKDVVALSDSTVKNKVFIGEGNYQVTAYTDGDACVSVGSNTAVFFDGLIELVPNAFKNYDIVLLTGENIILKGAGTIKGDKHLHAGQEGEWGMGVNIENAHNVSIVGLTIKDCWGDCVYVGAGSTNVRIEKCKLDHGRRQGISITSANGVIIKDCVITNVAGTSPEFAIDIEPNRNCVVDNVVIDKVTSQNCQGGFKATVYAENARVGTVVIRNCHVSSDEHFALRFVNCNKIVLEKCIILNTRKRRVLICAQVDTLSIKRNTFQFGGGIMDPIKNKAKNVLPDGDPGLISIIECENAVVQSNTELIIRIGE